MNATAIAEVEAQIAAVNFGADGLVCAVVQEYESGEVLMVAWMNPEALRRTLTTGRAWYWSRSRQEYWRKGDTSGHRQDVRVVALDCDGDAILVAVEQTGVACHTGTKTCFEGRQLVTVRPAIDSNPSDRAESPRDGHGVTA